MGKCSLRSGIRIILLDRTKPQRRKEEEIGCFGGLEEAKWAMGSRQG